MADAAAVERLVDTAARLEELPADQIFAGVRVIAPRYEPWEPRADGSYPWPNAAGPETTRRAQEEAFLRAVGESALLLTIVPPDGKLDRHVVAENAWAALRGTHRVLRRTAYPWPSLTFSSALTPDERCAVAELQWDTLGSGWSEASPDNNQQLRLGLQQQLRRVPGKLTRHNREVLSKIIERFLESLSGDN